MPRMTHLTKNGKYLFYYCQGCGHCHQISVGQGAAGPMWQWNGNRDHPTIHPSVREFVPAHDYEGQHYPEVTTCHHWLRNGQIEYLADSSSHQMRGVFPLTPIPDNYQLPE